MQSFRSELEDLENPIVEQDIIDLAKKIQLFHEGRIDEEKFRSLRLARGVYGQRQQGVQMVRIKIPFGRMTAQQLTRIANLSDEYASSNLHATTRQDIQIHYVSLDRTPELWAKLEQDDITLREACGNTVRNVTASGYAGVDPNEPFDVSPYAYEIFQYFLRNPVCQEMGRKFKIALSSSTEDSAFTFMHDVGLIPKTKIENGHEIRGFKVVIGGGLGSNPMLAQTAFEFLEENKIIPFIESLLRVFDRHGERARRQKARMKFLLKSIGLENLLDLAKAEEKALKVKTYEINRDILPDVTVQPKNKEYRKKTASNLEKYKFWLDTNIKPQKQKGFYSVAIKLTLGNMSSDTARAFADIVQEYAGDDIRVTINQGYILRFVRPEALAGLFSELDRLGLAEAGFDSTADITACPGTDTCNLGIASSTGIAKKLENVIRTEYPDLVKDNDIKIKISGCPNACGQHSIAAIGFHGSSIKNGKNLVPALQVLLGGSVGVNGTGTIAEKVIKLPSKRGADVLRTLFTDFDINQNEGEYYADYYARQGKKYFYNLLKPFADLESLQPSDYVDWGQEEKFEIIKAVGECAGVIIDLFQTLMFEVDEKLGWAKQNYAQENYSDAIYHAYNTFITGAKAVLLGKKKVRLNTHSAVMKAFDTHFVETGKTDFPNGFENFVLQIQKYEPTPEFAKKYIKQAEEFTVLIRELHEKEELVLV